MTRCPPTLLLALLVALSPVCTRAAAAQGPSVGMSPEAQRFLDLALDTIEAVTIHGDSVSWQVVRDSARIFAQGALVPADTYGAINWALRRANKHSFLQAGAPGATATLVDGRYGYVHVPQRGGEAVALADSLHGAVRRLADAGACGWVVDLRANGGGNMWPMLAGIGPLLGDSIVGAFGTGPEADRWFYRDGASGILSPTGVVDTVSRVTVPPLPTVSTDLPIALLIDGGTGSSGEAVAVAFHGRPNLTVLGSRTAGFATVNRGSRLSDGANMVVTTGYYANREGVGYPDVLEPDRSVDIPPGAWPFATDRLAREATEWLAGQEACTAVPGHASTPDDGRASRSEIQ